MKTSGGLTCSRRRLHGARALRWWAAPPGASARAQNRRPSPPPRQSAAAPELHRLLPLLALLLSHLLRGQEVLPPLTPGLSTARHDPSRPTAWGRRSSRLTDSVGTSVPNLEGLASRPHTMPQPRLPAKEQRLAELNRPAATPSWTPETSAFGLPI